MDYIHLQTEPIRLDELYKQVLASSCGAVASFIGAFEQTDVVSMTVLSFVL